VEDIDFKDRICKPIIFHPVKRLDNGDISTHEHQSDDKNGLRKKSSTRVIGSLLCNPSLCSQSCHTFSRWKSTWWCFDMILW
jgi:hypothetical protein